MWLSNLVRVAPKPLGRFGGRLHPAPRRFLTVEATLHYLEDREEYKTTKPYHINLPERAFAPGLQSNEVSLPYHNVPITGMRNILHNFQLDRNGFEVIVEDKHGADSLLDCVKYADFESEEAIVSKVRPAVESFLKRKIPGAEDVIAYSHQVRRRSQEYPRLPRGSDPKVPQPVQGVHVDMTPDSARAETYTPLLQRGYPDVSDRRWALISVWRPLFGPLEDWPLGLMDYQSLDNMRDLVASDNVYLHKLHETYNVLWNKAHKWYFLDNQQPHEVLVFKTFDTYAGKGHARVCPHAAFRNPQALGTARPRESFECLAVVLFPKGSAKGNPNEELLPSECSLEEFPERLAEMRGILI